MALVLLAHHTAEQPGLLTGSRLHGSRHDAHLRGYVERLSGDAFQRLVRRGYPERRLQSSRSSSKAAWSARTAFSTSLSLMMTVMRISLVVIRSMLMPWSASVRNMRAA